MSITGIYLASIPQTMETHLRPDLICQCISNRYCHQVSNQSRSRFGLIISQHSSVSISIASYCWWGCCPANLPSCLGMLCYNTRIKAVDDDSEDIFDRTAQDLKPRGKKLSMTSARRPLSPLNHYLPS